MKLFGKKTLALILALSMVMSVCVFAEDPVAVTSVSASLDKSTLVMGGETAKITATVLPAEASQEVTYKVTEGDAVMVAADGTVTAVKVGTATITVTTVGKKAPVGEATEGEAATTTCTVTVTPDRTKDITKVELSESAVEVPYGTSETDAKAELAKIKLTVTYGEGGTEEIAASSWSIASYSATTLGGYEAVPTITGKTFEDMPKATVKVEQAEIVGPSATLNKVTVPVSYTEAQAIAKLPTKVTVKLQDDSTRELAIGGDVLNAWDSSDYTEDAAGTYTFTASIKDTTNYIGNNITISVETKAALTAEKVALKMVADEYDDYASGLNGKVKEAIKSQFGVTVSDGTSVSYEGETYGSVSSGTYYMELTSGEKTTLRDDGSLKDEFTATVVYDGVTYTVPVELTIYYIVYNTGDDFDYKGGSLSAVATAISGRLNDIYGKGMYEIRFTSISDDGGDLYEDDTCEEIVEEDYSYSLDEMKAMTYLPNGTGEYTEISYTAWTTSDSQEIYGEITLDANAFVLLTGEIGSGDTLDFDADDILDAIYEADDELEVDYVKFTTLPASTKGYLYHEYDADKTSNTKVTTSKKYYVSATGTQLELTNYTYVPSKNASGVVEIIFKAYESASKSITGVIRVNVIEEADITVAVGKGESIAFDLDWFYDIVKEYASTSAKKKYEIAYIVFDNAPGSKSEGYLYVDGDKLTNPDGDKFYAYDSDDGDYDFDDLTFVGGNTAKTTHSTFSVYGRPSDSNSKPVVLVSNRTIDFVVGSSHSINNAQSPMKAAQVLNFYNELDAFESLGDNDNVYVEFTSLPKGGKLYYNYGMSTQKDVTVGTEYYITSASGKQLLRNVTFVPSYSADKIAKTISWGIKGYDKNGKSVTGTVDISVTYAYSSLYFSDISGSLYADSVDFLKNRGITTGVPGGKYDAAGQLSRAELVTFLYRAAGSPAVAGTSKFTDVPTNEYYYKAVLWAVQNGITKGTNAAGTLFSPYKKVTNQEIIQFMYNYDVNYLKHTSYVAGSSSHVYDYNKVADWAQVAVKWAVGKSVLTPGLLNPTTVGIRGDIALYLHRMLTL